MKYYMPVLVYLVFAMIYQIVAKTTPSNANPFAMLTVVYVVAAVVCGVISIFTKGDQTLGATFKAVPWTALALGVAVIALESSMVYAYRLGWDVSVFPTVVYVLVMVALVFVGALLFKEKITTRKAIGMLVCIAGLIIMRSK